MCIVKYEICQNIIRKSYLSMYKKHKWRNVHLYPRHKEQSHVSLNVLMDSNMKWKSHYNSLTLNCTRIGNLPFYWNRYQLYPDFRFYSFQFFFFFCYFRAVVWQTDWLNECRAEYITATFIASVHSSFYRKQTYYVLRITFII